MMMTHHIEHYQELVKVLFKAMGLTPEQEQQLIAPRNRVVDQKPVQDVIAFLNNAQKLIVCGDYDCDGICSTSIAMLMAKHLDIPAGYYIPNRFTEGYGVSKKTLQIAHQKGYTDVLIIDNGVKAFEALDYAREVGLRVAIVDHHLFDHAPEVDAFLHPEILDSYAQEMAASGLIYCVAEAMGIQTDYMLALSALGTIADVMPLWGKNRDIVRMGLDALRANNFKQFDGIVKPGKYTPYTAKNLAFKMIPKINSIGRMADEVNVNTAISYFTSDDPVAIADYIKQVEKLNDYRKALTKRYQDIALTHVDDAPFQVISHPDFHEGLVGIVANRISDITQKPTVVLTEYADHYKGSARSSTHSLHAIFSQLDPSYFEAMGGHDFAFGMTIKRAAFAAFKKDINTLVSNLRPHDHHETIITLDPTLINQKAIRELREFEPYGEGFKLPNVAIVLPIDYNLVDLKGYGYKFVFKDFPLNEAVYFTQNVSKQALKLCTQIIGTFDLGSDNKISFNVDNAL